MELHDVQEVEKHLQQEQQEIYHSWRSCWQTSEGSVTDLKLLSRLLLVITYISTLFDARKR